MHPGASNSNGSSSKGLLNHEEYLLVKKSFVQVFDDLIETTDQGDRNQIVVWLGEVIANYRLHKFISPPYIEEWTRQCLGDTVIQDLVFELLDRFSVEISSIENDAFHRLINNLAFGAASCKAVKTNQPLALSPVLESFSTSEDNARTVYLMNPWLVICTLLALEFKRTTLGSKIDVHNTR